MGRKIPGKKHKGVKDPLEQIARRNESLKTKLNAPPSNPNAQEVPKKVLELGRLISLAKEGKFERKKKRKRGKNNLIDINRLAGRDPKLPGMNRIQKNLPKLVQKPGESEESFLQRVNDVTEDFISEVEIEKKRDAVSDDEEEESEEDDSVSKKIKSWETASDRKKQAFKKKPNTQKKNENKENGTNKKSLNRRQRMKLKKASLLEVDEFSKFSDNVKFGEIVEQPPQLTARPKGATGPKHSKPGSKNLLLKNLMPSGKSSAPAKLKLSAIAKRNLEAQREAAVNAYRAIKAKRKENSCKN